MTQPQYRPLRFPSLTQFAAGAVHADAGNSIGWDGRAPSSDMRQVRDDGFREGRDSGYAIGHKEGHAAGFQEGLVQGAETGRQAIAELESLASPVDAMLKSLKRLQADYQAVQRREVIDLVAKLAREVIRTELVMQPTQLLTLVDETLAAMPPTREQIEVYLNPDELKRIVAADPKRAKRWSLLGDQRLQPGECRVKAGDHEVDAGCEQRLAGCVEQLKKSLLPGPDDADKPDAAARKAAK